MAALLSQKTTNDETYVENAMHYHCIIIHGWNFKICRIEIERLLDSRQQRKCKIGIYQCEQGVRRGTDSSITVTIG